MQKIIPTLWFNGTVAEALPFYESVFPSAKTEILQRYPTEGLPDWQAAFAGQPLIADLIIGGYQIQLLNAGDQYRPDRAFPFFVNFDPLNFEGDESRARTALDEAWTRLSATGTVLLPLDEYPYSPRYGWVEDQYGVNWQLMLTDPAGEPRPAIIPCLMFTGQANQAIEFYTGLFPGDRIGAKAPTEDGERVMFADFTIAESWFATMDAPADQTFEFNPGNSLLVNCDSQDEIDRLWDTLSVVPEAEQCGWLVDKYGLSWQICPANIGELLAKPGAYENMLKMKKIIIADF